MSLSNSILTWLQDPATDDGQIYTYVRSLPSEVRDEPEILSALFDELKRARKLAMKAEQIQEQDPATAISLILEKVTSESEKGAALSAELQTFDVLWHKVFAFVTVVDLEMIRVYVESVVAEPSREHLLTGIDELMGTILDEYAMHNYENFTLSESLRVTLIDFLKKISFLPEQVRTHLSTGECTYEKISQLQTIQFASTIANALLKKEELTKDDIFWGTWMLLQQRSKANYMKELIKRYRNTEELQVSEVEKKLIESLTLELTYEAIAGDSIEKRLLPYFKQLTPGQKKFFAKTLKEVVSNNSEIRFILGECEPEYVIDSLSKRTYKDTKEEFIESQQVRIPEVNWPVASKLLTFFGKVY